MKRKIGGSILCFSVMLSLAGCGNAIPELSETTQKMVTEYAVNVVREYDAMRISRLMDLDTLQKKLEKEAILEAMLLTDYSKEDEAENETAKEKNKADAEEAEKNKATGVSLEKALMLEDTDVAYAGYEIAEAYPQDTENIYFTMDATDGRKLVIMKFDVSNKSQADKEYDILSKNVSFKVIVDGESNHTLTTMLLNDLSSYQGTIPAGEKEQLVLVCEVPEEKVQNIASMALKMKSGSETVEIALE